MDKRENSVAVLGLGIMGRALANHLYEDGLLVASWNRTAKPDFTCFESDIIKAVQSARIILIVVTDGPAVNELITSIESRLEKDQIIVQCATVKPDENIGFNQRITKTGARFIEALLGGSEAAALARKLPIYFGGDENTVAEVLPVLEKLSSQCVHVGEIGTASVAKLAMNLNLAMQVEAMCESYAYARSNGLSDDQYFNVFKTNTGWNYLAEYKEPKLRQRDFTAQFSVRNMLKDIKLALSTDNTSHGMKLLEQTEKLYSSSVENGFGEEDMITLLKQIQDQEVP